MTQYRLNRRHLIGLGAASGLLSACSLPPELGRGDRAPIEGGIGGTGIVGVVTEFDGLIVNGLKIDTDGRTRFSNATGRLTERNIGLGDGLTIEAEAKGGRLVARRVHVAHPLIGRIEASAGDGSMLRINGVNVMVEPQAQNRAGPGDRVKVSGLWMGDIVVASQIIRTRTDVDVIAGEAQVADQILSIGQVPVTQNLIGTRVKDGQFITVMGKFEDHCMEPKRITRERFTGAAGPLKQLSVEGYLSPAPTNRLAEARPNVKLSALGHSFVDDQRMGPFEVNNRALFEGSYLNAFKVERGLALPRSYGERRQIFMARAMGQENSDWTAIT